MNREMRWYQIAGNSSMDTYESLLRLCDGSDPFSKRGSLFCAFDAGEMLIPNALLPSFIMRDFFLLFLSFVAKITYVDIAGL